MTMDATIAPAEPTKASLVGALRELEAAKGRVERDAQVSCDAMKKRLVLAILPVLDNLDRTIAAAKQSRDAPAVLQGAHLVRAQLETVLLGYGVERVEAFGAPFDPALHEAITQVAVRNPLSHQHVVDQLEPGYRFGGALLRPAKVVVGRYY